MDGVFVRTMKEIARHNLHRLGWSRSDPHLQRAERRDRFSEIYSKGVWRHNDPETPLSGVGSSVRATTAVREQLPGVLRQLDCRSLLDLGCGDLTWMRGLDLGVDYIGADIVEDVIQRNRSIMPSAQFHVVDATRDALPAANVVLCREVLFHLSFEDIKAVLSNIRGGGFEYLIATSDQGTRFNADIVSGDYRMLNLRIAPLKLPPPGLTIRDDAVFSGRHLGVWPVSDLPTFAPV